MGFEKKHSKAFLRFRVWTTSPSSTTTPGLRLLIPVVGSTLIAYSPVGIYFRHSKECMSGLAAGRSDLVVGGGVLYSVLCLQSEQGDLDPVSCSCSGETIELTLLTKRRLIFTRLPMIPGEILNVMELIYKHAMDLCTRL